MFSFIDLAINAINERLLIFLTNMVLVFVYPLNSVKLCLPVIRSNEIQYINIHNCYTFLVNQYFYHYMSVCKKYLKYWLIFTTRDFEIHAYKGPQKGHEKLFMYSKYFSSQIYFPQNFDVVSYNFFFVFCDGFYFKVCFISQLCRIHSFGCYLLDIHFFYPFFSTCVLT